MKTYLLNNDDGSVSIMTLLSGTVEESIAKMPAGKTIVGFREIDPADVPTDRKDRDAWQDTGKITVNLARVKR